MGRASADHSVSGRDAPARRRRRGFHLRRRRSPTPTSPDATSQELNPLSSAASVSQQPPFLPYPEHATGSCVVAVVVPLPTFRGDPGECPDAHLGRFDRACLANGDATSATAARIFPASLDADAAVWYELTTAAGAVEDDSSSSPPPWDAVRAAFLDFFRPPGAADRARAEIKSLRQRPGEAVRRYHLRMQGILRRFPDVADDVPDAFLKDAFVGGLDGEFQDWVVAQRPETLDEAVSLAVTWERAESVRAARRAAKQAWRGCSFEKCAFCGVEGHEEAKCEARSGMRELWRRSSSSRGRPGGAVAANEDGEETGGGSTTLARLGSTRSTQYRCRKHRGSKKAAAESEVGGGEGNGAAGRGRAQVTELTNLINIMDF